MTWDAHKYEQWFASEPGRFALAREQRLLERMVADWPRRCRKLIEIGCGTGIFLHSLWETGFDVTGVDKSPVMLKAARERFGSRAALHLGDGCHLPFEDNEFDFAMLWSVLEFASDPMAMLSEACRVADEGLLIGFLNRNSLYYWYHGRDPKHSLGRAKWFTLTEIRGMLRQITPHKPSLVHSVLPGPVWTWKESLPWRLLNNRISPPWLFLPMLGAFNAVRVDFKDRKPLNPLHSLAPKPGGA